MKLNFSISSASLRSALFLGLLFIAMYSTFGQTTISAGPVTGTWKKTGSPYKITGQIYVPKDSTLKIESGVKVEFQGAYMLHVYGSVQALGKPADTVTFTPVNKTTGWQGIHIHKNKVGADSNLFGWCKFEYVYYMNYTLLRGHGAIFLDTVSNARISHSLFQKNKSNYGCGIVVYRGKCIVSNCDFVENIATDERGVNSTAASGAGIMCPYSTMEIVNCNFIDNRHSLPGNPNDSLAALCGAPVTAAVCNLTMNNCLFKGNHSSGCSGLFIVFGPGAKYRIDNTVFMNNYSMTRPVLYISYTTGNPTVECVIRNTTMMNNRKGAIFGPPNATFGSIGTAYDGSRDGNISFVGLRMFDHNGYAAFSGSNEKISNMIALGSDSICLYFPGGGNPTVQNSILANNGLAIDFRDFGTMFIANSIITHNGAAYVPGATPKGGIFMSEAGAAFNLFNSIIQSNRINSEYMNIGGGRNAKTIPFFRNNIVEGGLDSAKSFFGGGAVVATSASGNISDTVSFVKPPKGIGPAFYDTTSDFHYLNTCSYTYPGWNKGLNTFSDGVTYVDHTFQGSVDLDGKPRIRCGTVDIGPYELEGSKQNVSIDNEPVDQLVCPKSAVNISPGICGASVDYQWQHSTDGNNFSNISGANNADYNFIPQDSAWYRLIITQAECNKRDTSRAAKVAINKAGTINIISGPKDTSVCAGSMVNLKATVQGSNLVFGWQNSPDGNSFANISGASTNPFLQKINNTNWYRLVVKNTLCNIEDTTSTAKITAHQLPVPNLGADATIPNAGNKLLNPGSFSFYQWNLPKINPATSASLTVDSSNLDTGKNTVWVEVTDANGCKGRDTVIIRLEPAIGLANPAIAGIKIYPIPAENYLHIELPNSNICIWALRNGAGAVVRTGSGTEKLDISLAEWSSGIYTLELLNAGKLYSSRISIMK